MTRTERKYLAIIVFTIIAIVASIGGFILMIIASFQEFGWITLFANRHSFTSFFAITRMWHLPIYRIGFISCFCGSILCKIMQRIIDNIK